MESNKPSITWGASMGKDKNGKLIAVRSSRKDGTLYTKEEMEKYLKDNNITII